MLSDAANIGELVDLLAVPRSTSRGQGERAQSINAVASPQQYALDKDVCAMPPQSRLRAPG
jgi:hypothetical protein